MMGGRCDREQVLQTIAGEASTIVVSTGGAVRVGVRVRVRGCGRLVTGGCGAQRGRCRREWLEA